MMMDKFHSWKSSIETAVDETVEKFLYLICYDITGELYCYLMELRRESDGRSFLGAFLLSLSIDYVINVSFNSSIFLWILLSAFSIPTHAS